MNSAEWCSRTTVTAAPAITDATNAGSPRLTAGSKRSGDQTQSIRCPATSAAVTQSSTATAIAGPSTWWRSSRSAASAAIATTSSAMPDSDSTTSRRRRPRTN